jgi:hypothetical protein
MGLRRAQSVRHRVGQGKASQAKGRNSCNVYTSGALPAPWQPCRCLVSSLWEALNSIQSLGPALPKTSMFQLTSCPC